MKQEVKNEIIYILAQVKVIKHTQNIYASRECEKQGIKGTIIYANAMQIDRQEKDFKRLVVNLSRQNMSNWVIKGAKFLEPSELKKELLKNEVLHADETVLEVLNETGRTETSNSYMWLYRSSGDVKNHVVLYDYTEGRAGKFAVEYLEGRIFELRWICRIA